MAALRIPNNVQVSATQNGWMTGAEMAIWQNRTWGPNWDDVRRLLILDQASVHTMNDTKTALANVQTDIIYVPAGCTSISQPADVSWNAPFKNLLRAEWKLWRQIEEGTPGVISKWLPGRMSSIGFHVHGKVRVKGSLCIHSRPLEFLQPLMDLKIIS